MPHNENKFDGTQNIILSDVVFTHRVSTMLLIPSPTKQNPSNSGKATQKPKLRAPISTILDPWSLLTRNHHTC